MVLESPHVVKMNTFKYNASSTSQPPIFFHNTNTSMETIPQLQYHNTSAFSTNKITYLKPPPSSHNLESKSSTPQQVVVEDSEISIFDAQKYFNDTNDPKTRTSISPPIISTTPDHTIINNNNNNNSNIINPSRLSCGSNGYNRVRSFHATPTASSEASWNSQTGLLSHPAGGLAVSLRNLPNTNSNSNNQERLKGGSSSAKWFFRRKCPCSGKKSVQVEEQAAATAANSYTKPPRPIIDQQLVQPSTERVSISSSTRQNLISSSPRHDQFSNKAFLKHQQPPRLSGSARPVNDGPAGGFSFPILNNLQHNTVQDEPPRDSLEVFQPAEEPRKARFGFPGSPISNKIEDDIASDASSDLFEIESFSTQTTTNYPMYRRRDSLDEAQNFNSRRLLNSNMYGRRSVDETMTPSIAPTECYEPSEASIDWSVTTAEGFERSSVTNFSISASEFDEQAWINNGGGGKYKKGNGGGLLMSCRHDKAVSVGPQPVRCGSGDGGMAPLMSTFMHVGGRVIQNKNNNKKKQPPLARSHSARLSLAFAA